MNPKTRERITIKDLQQLTGFSKTQAEVLFQKMREKKEERMNEKNPDRALKQVYLFAEEVAAEFGISLQTVLRHITP